MEEKKTVTMVFPNPVLLTVEGNARIRFEQGVQEVPVEHADHPYLKAHGVKKYEPEEAPPVKVIVPGGGQLVGQKEKNPDHKTLEELQGMTKEQLVGHASDVHDLDLDPRDKKENLIAAIIAEQQK